jgi:hypothetical protein
VVNARARIPQEAKTQGRIGWWSKRWKHLRLQDRIPDRVKARELISTGETLQISIWNVLSVEATACGGRLVERQAYLIRGIKPSKSESRGRELGEIPGRVERGTNRHGVVKTRRRIVGRAGNPVRYS